MITRTEAEMPGESNRSERERSEEYRKERDQINSKYKKPGESRM